MNKKRIYFDMDGVLVDFQTGIDKLDEATKEQYKGKLDEVPGIFSLMEPIPGAAEVVRLLARNYDVFILTTSPWNNPTAASDKVEWVKKYLDDVFHKRVIITHRKDLLDGDYLIDDRGKNGTSEFKGEWIHFGSEKFPDWESVLKYLLM
jgi:5'(3')-deoxyribonucleotidase